MNAIKLKLIAISFLFTPSISLAFFCPTNFRQISVGDTIDQVQQQCGKPDKQETKEQKQDEGPQQWDYYIPQTVSSNYMEPQQGTLKTQVAFDSSGKAINISVNGIGVGSTTICGTMVSLGDTRDKIKSACGEPSFINKQNNENATGPMGATEQGSQKITTFTYNTNPPVTLKFVDGKLVQ